MTTTLLQPSRVAVVLLGAHACAPAAVGMVDGTVVPTARIRTGLDAAVPFPPPRGAPV